MQDDNNYNATQGLDNAEGTIFLTSTLRDEGALKETLNKIDVNEAESATSLKERTKIVIKQLKHMNTVYSLSLDINKSAILSIVEEFAKRIRSSQNYNPTVFIALNLKDAGESKHIAVALKKLGLLTHIVDLNLGSSKTIADSAKNLGEKFQELVLRVYLDPENKFQQYLNWIRLDHHSDLSTGFEELDRTLGGGLSNDLYVLGAPSSIGKSTLALQIADNLGENRHHVLYYSLEMDFRHVISKSISRIAFQQKGPQYDKYSVLPTALKLYQGKWLDTFYGSKKADKENLANILLACQRYGNISLYVHLWSTNKRLPTAQDIYDDVENFIARTGETPVVIIDYLQLLRSPEDQQNQTDKQRVSEAIWKLKTISRDFDVPVIAISSFNRSSYSEATVDMSALKESGEIDYSAETIITLGYDLEHTRIINDSDAGSGWLGKTIAEWQEKEKKDRKEAIALWKKQPERAVAVRFLKNRYGAISNDVILFTNARYDAFMNAKKENGILIADLGGFTDEQKQRKISENQKFEVKNGQLNTSVEDMELLSDLPF